MWYYKFGDLWNFFWYILSKNYLKKKFKIFQNFLDFEFFSEIILFFGKFCENIKKIIGPN